MSEKMSLNKKMEELDKKTSWFYSDDFNLDESVEKYKEAMGLATEIKKDLEELKNEIEVLSEDFSK